MTENIILAFQSVWSHKLRSFLTMLGVIIGIASIIAIVSCIQGTTQQIKENVVGAGGNVTVVSVTTSEGWAVDPSYEQISGVSIVDPRAVDEMNQLASVEAVSLIHTRSYTSDVYAGDNSMTGSLTGVDANYLDLADYRVVSGRGLVDEDFTHARKVVLLDVAAARALFPGQDAINQTVEIKGEPFVVVGLVEKVVTNQVEIKNMTDYYMYSASTAMGSAIIPDSTWSIVYQYDEPYSVAVRAPSPDDLSAAGSSVAEYLNANYVTGTSHKYTSVNLEETAAELQQIATAMTGLLVWIAGISLLVGGIGVMNIMMVSVAERTREIGLKKAIGAKRRAILGQFLTEAAVLTMLGGIIGVILGLSLSKLMTLIIGIPSAVSVPACIFAVAFSVLVGLVFGLLPAVKASRLNPIEALRYE